MIPSHISPKIYDTFWGAFRRHSHRFLAIGYQQALPRILDEHGEEPDITGYICEAIKDWFLVHPKESFGFFVVDDPILSGNRRAGKDRFKTDIIISYAAGSRPEFFFEAKRLHRTKAIASRYIGEKGMGCFISGRYASDCHEAAMIGYVQSDTLEHWQTTLQSKIETDRSKLKIDSIDNPVSFQDSFPLEWSSAHQREALAAIKLFHILLDCRKSDAIAEQTT